MFAAHGVAVAYLFGSRADGTARPDSDHDTAVLFAAGEPVLDARLRWIEFRPVREETSRTRFTKLPMKLI